jgi:single stranded DNA-binding protein
MATLMQVMIPNQMAECTIMGRVTRDSGGAKFTDGGTKVANVSFAISRRYQQGEEWKEETQFYTVAVWGDAADRAGACKKGEIVTVTYSAADVEGRMYDDNNGQKKVALQIKRGQVSKVAWIPAGNGNGAAGAGETVIPAVVPVTEGAFPF